MRSTRWPRASSAFDARAGDPGRHPPLRDLGSPADSLLHSARRRLGLRLERGRSGARRARDALAAGRRRAARATRSRQPRRRSRSRSSCCASAPAADARRAPAANADLAQTRESDFTLGNGTYALELSREGLGFSRVMSSAHGGREIDLTRRPDEPLSLRGKLFYLRDLDPRLADGERAWSLGGAAVASAWARTTPSRSPRHHAVDREHVRRRARRGRDRGRRRRIPSRPGGSGSRTSRIGRARLEITSYQELALDVADA